MKKMFCKLMGPLCCWLHDFVFKKFSEFIILVRLFFGKKMCSTEEVRKAEQAAAHERQAKDKEEAERLEAQCVCSLASAVPVRSWYKKPTSSAFLSPC